MKIKTIYITAILCVFGFLVSAQNSINNYKYIIVPDQYEFTVGKDKYQLNSLTKFLFNKYGYTAFMFGDEMPSDYESNKCLGLTSEVKKIKAFLKTKLQIDLVDCNGNVIASSRIGESKQKEYAKAYNTAIRDAFVTFQSASYEYIPNDAIVSLSKPVESNTDAQREAEAKIKELEEEVKALKEVKEKEEEVSDKLEKVKEITEPQEEEEIIVEEVTKEVKDETNMNVLYAQPINNGFQLVDTTPKKVMVLLKTNKPGMFIVKGKDAIVYQENGKWIYTKTSEEGFNSYPLSIKF